MKQLVKVLNTSFNLKKNVGANRKREKEDKTDKKKTQDLAYLRR